MMPEFRCDLAANAIPLNHVWEHCLGSGHAALALRSDWQSQLRRCHAELGIRYARFHGILDDDLGTLITVNDQFLYSFFNADQIYDYLRSIDMRPIVELSFMPWNLASGPKTVFNYRAHVEPPKDYGAWATLIEKLVRHWVERYGAPEVRQWYFEVWNEPNLTAFWTGKTDDYFKLYQVTAEAIKRVDPALRVGGPVTAMAAWVPEFLQFCEQKQVPADFVSTHYYPTDAFGKPGADTITQLAHASRHVMRDQARLTQQQAKGRPVLYTEWSASSNPRDELHDDPYTAAFVAKTVLEVSPFVDCYSLWTFSDIFDENYFPSEPFQGGFGLLTLHGIPKPAYRAYQLLHRLGNEQLPVEGSHETVDTWIARKDDSVTVFVTNFAFPRHPIENETVHVRLTNVPQPRGAFVERVDSEHANAKALWQTMGKPTYLSGLQVERLIEASSLTAEPFSWTYENGTLHLDLDVPPLGVAAVTVEWLSADDTISAVK
jgi:xylan 1,4-beta-xylosidase